MSFHGYTFSFDGISCEEFGLMLYNIGSNRQDATTFSTTPTIIEDRIVSRYRSLFYGASVNEPLKFKLIFGLHPNLYEDDAVFDRSDFQKISSWLTGKRSYKWLTIDQDDLFGASFRCFMTDLQALDVSIYPCAFSCSVICDSPYAYLPPRSFHFSVNGASTVSLWSECSMNEPYYPIVVVSPNGPCDVKITNLSDSSRSFALSSIPAGCGKITIDCENMIVTTENGFDLYQNSNFKFPRLWRGLNQLRLEGNATVSFICRFPVNIGG